MAKRWARGVVLWTLVLLVVAIVLAVVAVTSLMDAQQRCFFEYPSAACPDGRDWRVGLLTFAFFGVPLIWLVGAVAAIVGRVLARRRRAAWRRRRISGAWPPGDDRLS
jgi:hypothetical protein